MKSLEKGITRQCDLTPFSGSFFKLVLLLSYSVLMLAINSDAGELSLDFAKLRTAQKATFVLVPWNDLGAWKHIKKWDEDTFRQIGCTYTTQDPARIGSLVGIIQRGELMPQQSLRHSGVFFRSEGFEVMAGARQAVYLSFTDGSEARFMISDYKAVELNFPPAFDDAPFYAQKTLPWYLLFWASQLGQPVASDAEAEAECGRQIRIRVYGFLH